MRGYFGSLRFAADVNSKPRHGDLSLNGRSRTARRSSVICKKIADPTPMEAGVPLQKRDRPDDWDSSMLNRYSDYGLQDGVLVFDPDTDVHPSPSVPAPTIVNGARMWSFGN